MEDRQIRAFISSTFRDMQEERQQREAFATSPLRCFQGRTREVRQLTDFLQSTVAPCKKNSNRVEI